MSSMDTNGLPHADSAAFAIVMVVTNPENGKYNQASQIIVPTDTKGFEIIRNISIMGKKGSRAQRNSLHDVRVPSKSHWPRRKVLPLPNKDSTKCIHHCTDGLVYGRAIPDVPKSDTVF